MEKNSLIPILEQIEKDKGIKKEEIIKMIEASLVSAYRKQYGKNINVVASIDPETSEIKASVIKKVVETVHNASEEISVDELKSLKLKGELDSDVEIPVDTAEFGRIAAQIAKQIIIQKIREVERTTLFEQFSEKEKSLANGAVFRFADRNIIIDLGKAEAIMPVSEQVRRERFNIGERIKVLVLKVERGGRGPQILVSRSHPDLVARLMELEVPEISEKIVEILKVVRDPGFRSKIAVKSNSPKVDPVGTCVGVRGSRIRPIIDELRGERIDLIPWNSEPEKFIASALSPAKVLSVSLSKEGKRAEVMVPNDMLMIAIGRNGQNVRLASQLTGWSIDVKSELQKKEESAKNNELAQKELGRIEGVGPKLADVLIKGGWISVEKIAGTSIEQLTSLQGIGEKTAEKLIESAKFVIDNEKKTEEVKTSAQESEDVQGEVSSGSPARRGQNNSRSKEETAEERVSETKEDSSD